MKTKLSEPPPPSFAGRDSATAGERESEKHEPPKNNRKRR